MDWPNGAIWLVWRSHAPGCARPASFFCSARYLALVHVGIVSKMNTVTNVTEPTRNGYAIGWHATETPRHWSTDDR